MSPPLVEPTDVTADEVPPSELFACSLMHKLFTTVKGYCGKYPVYFTFPVGLMDISDLSMDSKAILMDP